MHLQLGTYFGIQVLEQEFRQKAMLRLNNSKLSDFGGFQSPEVRKEITRFLYLGQNIVCSQNIER